MRDGWDLANDNEPLYFDCFENEDYFSATLHEVGITEVAQDDDYKQNDNGDKNRNTNKDPDNPPGIALHPKSVFGKIAGMRESLRDFVSLRSII